MFHQVSLGLIRIVCPFLFQSSIVFLNAKSNNQIFIAHFLSFMLKVILEIFLSRGNFSIIATLEKFRSTPFPQHVSHGGLLEVLGLDWT